MKFNEEEEAYINSIVNYKEPSVHEKARRYDYMIKGLCPSDYDSEMIYEECELYGADDSDCISCWMYNTLKKERDKRDDQR